MENEKLLKKVSLNEITTLQTICKETYALYFGDHWIGEGLELYIEEQFGTDRLLSDLSDSVIGYFFIWYQAKPIGYLKINYEAGLENFHKEKTCEVEKMYLFPEYKGLGIGKQALHSIINLTRRMGKKTLFLGVLDTNESAISFYEKVGFKFHSKIQLKYIYFKEKLKGLNQMYLELNQ